ncbi:hypothetical protein EPUS_08453 [Endocarpon pusillum Z07020]|uniref:Uncharacterized protein n=1 Tax=Endocarpon pusillum (strain Z07020 / HMAS-L-300199) TaxID=1263415 RepID=U1I4W0_ENDPU|nr:uncharacterized protein EPUS_08453 [Endocarpon pusillum Z07020]ERF77149.1 hypothetical protein EPUS_08453 [Endocarpon pusillum Z07020]
MEGYDNGLPAQGFYSQAANLWVRHPKSCSPASSFSSDRTAFHNIPSLRLFFSWTSARPRPISKYTTEYIEMFPSIPIMIITTTLTDLAFKSERSKQSALLPVVDYIISRHLDQNIHVHCFSEGGSHKAIQLAEAYLYTTARKMPLTSLCLDSTPGDHQYHRIARAFKQSLPPNYLLRVLGLIFAYLMLTYLWCFYVIYGPKKNLMSRIRRGLEDQRLWDTHHIPRCYLYSKKDTLIKHQDVERHAVKAMRKGIPVVLATFERSEHCHHVREDKEKYWLAVKWTLQRRRVQSSDGVRVDVKIERDNSAAERASAPVVSTREVRPRDPVAQRGS